MTDSHIGKSDSAVRGNPAAATDLNTILQAINDLKTTSNCTENSESWQSLKEENQKLQTKVHQLEINNTKLKMKLSWIEDKLVDNNLLFCGIGESNGESEKDRYEAIL